jgi:Family of unknown function (DUF6176)
VIKVAVRKVKPDEENNLRQWMAELTRRSAEVRETFAQEGVRHEQAFLLKTAEGSVLIYAMEAADHERAASAYRNSALPIDLEHRRIMTQVLGEPANVELLYECVAEDDAC